MKTTASAQKKIVEEHSFQSARDLAQNPSIQSAAQSFGTFAESWLQTRAAAIKQSTYTGYAYCLHTHILPYFGAALLTSLTGEFILGFLEDMNQKHLSDTTMHSILTVFRSILKRGIQMELLDRGLLDYCSVSYRKPEPKILSFRDSDAMKEYLLEKNTPFSMAILLCRDTGIRVGELCGLKWEDIDFTSNTIRIRRTVSRIPNPDQAQGQPRTILYIRTPKSRSSIREIPIPLYLVDSLKAIGGEAGSYFLTGQDTCTEPRNVQKKFKTILKHCEMPDCDFNAMRRGFAVECLEKGADCRAVSSILGYASARTVADIDVPASLEQKQDCINAISCR